MTRKEVIEFIQQIQFGYLATVGSDNAPRVRPVSIKDVYGDDLYFFTFSTTRKVAEMAANPQVEVVWAKEEETSQVRIKGKAVVVKDEAIQKRFLEDNPIAARILPEAAQHLFRLYKVQPENVWIARGLVPYTEVAW
ncbi:MAG: pyridoxamine 5'-phosphate oxidase family protein [Chloroflexi bacterium]|nr:pyridoxamine 5'-phosphate oxidase family protein [Chloroflexota bacterium]